jgi:hypothetical protein
VRQAGTSTSASSATAERSPRAGLTDQRPGSADYAERTCRTCGETKPLDIEHFYSNGKPLEPPPPFRLDCIPCVQDARKRKYEAAKRAKARPKRARPKPQPPAEVTDLRAVRMVEAMGRADRAEYALEGCLPLTGSLFGFTEEDLDATPVPSGCHDCYLSAGGGLRGMRCDRCPSKGQPMKRKAT